MFPTSECTVDIDEAKAVIRLRPGRDTAVVTVPDCDKEVTEPDVRTMLQVINYFTYVKAFFLTA